MDDQGRFHGELLRRIEKHDKQKIVNLFAQASIMITHLRGDDFQPVFKIPGGPTSK
jgi:hypothetical protein